MSTNAQPIRRRRATSTRAHRIAPTTAGLMALCALLLIGVVFVQIAVIRQNMDRSDLDTRIGSVTAENSDLKTQITRRSSSPRIAEWATAHGMVAVLPGDVTPLTARPVGGG